MNERYSEMIALSRAGAGSKTAGMMNLALDVKGNRMNDRMRMMAGTRVLFRMALVTLFMLAGFFSAPQGADAAITTLNPWAVQYQATAYPNGTINASYSIGGGSNRLLVVAIASTRTAVGTQTVSVSYGNQPLSLAAGDGGSTVTWNHTYLYYLDETGIQAATGTNLDVTISGGTQYNNYVAAAVYEGVDPSTPFTDAKNFNSTITADSNIGPFNPALTIADGDQAVQIVNLARSTAGTTGRTVSTWAAGWTTAGLQATQVITSGPTFNAYVRERDVTTAASDTSQHTASSTTTWDSMTAMSIMPFVCPDATPSTLEVPAGRSASGNPFDVTGLYTATGNVGSFEYKTSVYAAGVPAAKSYYMWADNTTDLGTDGTANLPSGAPSSFTGYPAKTTLGTAEQGSGSRYYPAGFPTSGQWYVVERLYAPAYANPVDISNISGSMAVRPANSSDQVRFDLYDYDPAGAPDNKTLVATGTAKTVGTAGTTAQVTWTSTNFTISGTGRVEKDHQLLIETSYYYAGTAGVRFYFGLAGTTTSSNFTVTETPQVPTTCTDWTTGSNMPATATSCGNYADGGTYVFDVRGTDPDCGTNLAASADFTWYSCTSTSPYDLAVSLVRYNYVDLTWTYDGAKNTSYNVYRNPGGLIASGITTGSYHDGTVADNTAYTYTVRGDNGSCESGYPSNTLPVTTPVTTPVYTPQTITGEMSFSNVTPSSMKVAVAYTGDDNEGNNLTLNYGTNPGGPYPTPASVVVDRALRTWTATISGLSQTTDYYFEATFTDAADGVSGTNPVLGTKRTKTITLLHSSGSTGDKYGSWGTAFTCATCHQSNAPNVKRIRAQVYAPGETYNSNTLTATVAGGSSTDYADNAATNRVCDTCHTQTAIYGDGTGNATSGSPLMITGSSPPHPADPDCIKCHQHNAGFKLRAQCESCHALGATYQAATSAPIIVDTAGSPLRGENYGGHLMLAVGEDLSGVTNWTARCLSCHDGHVKNPDAGVHILNNTSVGIDYLRGYIALGGTATNGATEAEICWNCHAPIGVSEWGTNTAQTGSPVASQYDYGTLDTPNWTTATWTSGKADFGYKTGPIQSTHSASTAGTAEVIGSAYAYTETVDDVANIRCSYCHDVHNTASFKIGAADRDGKPYLRGAWYSNPYEEDGAPQSGQTYVNDQRFGAVPRGNGALTKRLGGFWIDINNVQPGTATTTTDGTAYVNPTNGWTLADSAGLCTLCHNGAVNTMDYTPSESLWLGTNGHANAVIGGTGTGAANIFNMRGSTVSNAPVNPPMHFYGAGDPRTAGYRNAGVSRNYTPALNPNGENNELTTMAQNNWGSLSIDASTINSLYHKFSCSKCHNPHASRLPKLMITNCLDTKHNTWDDSYQLNTANTSSISYNRSISNWSSAQNCHRVGGIADGSGPEPVDAGAVGATHGTGSDYSNRGWNIVTPW